MEFDVHISDMTVGAHIEGFYILKKADPRTTNAGKPYLSCTLSDVSGSIDAVAWDYPGPVGKDNEGAIVKIRGVVADYKGKTQITIERIRLPVESDRFDLGSLVPTAPLNEEDAIEEIRGFIASIEDEQYRSVCNTMLTRHFDSFTKIPAAKSIHHSFINGLLMHTLNMMRAADFFSELYYETINRSLLLSGVLLHDFGKDKEFGISDIGLVTDYTVKGHLLGHLYMCAEEIGEVCAELGVDDEKSMLLRHLVLSHHGEPEFGACVIPSCAEAELLSMLDKLDSRMEIYTDTVFKTPKGKFSDKIFALDKRIYNHLDN